MPETKTVPSKSTNSKMLGSFSELLDSGTLKDIKTLYKKSGKNDEFELMFFNYKRDQNRMGMENFSKVLEYLKAKSHIKKLKLVTTVTLDISYTEREKEQTYRVTIDGLSNITKYMERLHLRPNHVIFTVLAGISVKDKAITVIKKVKEKENKLDIDDYNVRFRLSKELPVGKDELEDVKSLDETKRNDIMFRYKQRTSLIVQDDKDGVISIDLTDTKMSKNINVLDRTVSIYELEIDFSPKVDKPAGKNLDTIMSESTTLFKILQQSNFIITTRLEKEVLDLYIDLLNVDTTRYTSLAGRKPESLELQHVVDKLPNKYAVTDKADGERFFLIIHKDHIFLISGNLHVKNTGIVLPKGKSAYNNSILDGELIFIPKQNRHIFLIFDCLYAKGEDVRSKELLVDRLKYADDVVENCFVFKGQKGYEFKEFKGTFNTNNLLKFHDKEINSYIQNLNHDIGVNKSLILIRRKYFLPVYGIQDNEIFKYSELLYRLYVFDDKVNCPYILDGLIYHPLNQKYVMRKESVLVEYKWKPPEKNSIDFYVTFEKSRDTGKVLVLYDNSVDEFSRNKPYKVINLHVGRRTRSGEQPTLFQKESNKYIAHLFLENGEVRDEEGKIIQDNTVVEFYYNNDMAIPEKHRWVPMRTRYDKTESVRKYGKQYGNFIDIANKVWRSIENPFVFDDVVTLSKDSVYQKHLQSLRSKVGHSIILSERQENAYYQKITNLAAPMRNFHNWIKSIVIYTHCNSIYVRGKNLSILDLACGRGGDQMKFYYGKINYYVGVDIDANSLLSPVDSSVSRYNQLRKTHPNFPSMSFIHADIGAPLNYEDQNKRLGGMSGRNKALMEKYFSKDPKKSTQFDLVNIQFAIHYLLSNETSWNNFTENVNRQLKPGGQFLVTTFDGERVYELLEGKENFTAKYTNKRGEEEVLFELVKKYKDSEVDKSNFGLGVPIDVHNTMYSQDGKYITEYLVHKDFLIRELEKRCDLELMETDLFENQYRVSEQFLTKYYETEENPKTRGFFKKVASFYDMTSSVNKASFQMTRLNRYYVFRKRNKKSGNQSGGNPIIQNKVSVNKEISIKGIKNFPAKRYFTRQISGSNTFYSSIHDILKVEGVVPNTTTTEEFFDELGLDIKPDTSVDKRCIKKVCKSTTVGHKVDDEATEMALEGLNILVLDEKGSIINHVKGGSKNTVILIKDDKGYAPVYRVYKNKRIGLFSSRSKLVKSF